MTISSYATLIKAAAAQSEPQRLLFAFARADLPFDASGKEKELFEQGQGGTLTPVMCVDKLVPELSTFEALADESRQTGQDWDVVFVASLGGSGGQPPASSQADGPLRKMIGAIQSGQLDSFLAFDRKGELLSLHQ